MNKIEQTYIDKSAIIAKHFFSINDIELVKKTAKEYYENKVTEFALLDDEAILNDSPTDEDTDLAATVVEMLSFTKLLNEKQAMKFMFGF